MQLGIRLSFLWYHVGLYVCLCASNKPMPLLEVLISGRFISISLITTVLFQSFPDLSCLLSWKIFNPKNFKNNFQRNMMYFYWDYIKFIKSGITDIFIMLSLLLQEYCMTFHLLKSTFFFFYLSGVLGFKNIFFVHIRLCLYLRIVWLDFGNWHGVFTSFIMSKQFFLVYKDYRWLNIKFKNWFFSKFLFSF